LRKRPEERFRTITEVRAALETASIDRPAAKQSSVAVLPFTNMSADKENEYFGDELAEEILNLLAKIPGLKVIARTSSFAFRGKEQDITRIAKALRVEYILEGSVRRAGNRIRVTAQLIHAADGAHLWAERYDRDLTDLFAIQDEIGQAISEALKVRLAPRVQVVNVEAWQHCLKGEYYRLRYTPEGLAKAKEHLEQSIAIDPNYARAHSKLAAYYYMLAILNLKPASEMVPLAKAAAAQALALEPANGEFHSLPAVIAAVFDHDWKAAENHHRKALAAEVVSPYSRYCYSSYYMLPWGRTEEAVKESHLALDGDPLSVPLHFGLASALYGARQYNESIECARRALEIDPNSYFIWDTMGQAQLASGQTDDAITSLKRSVDLAPWYTIAVGSLASAYHRAGDQERAREWAQRLAVSRGHSVGMAQYYATTGEVDAMFEALEGAYEQRDVFLLWLQSWTSFEPYRADPRFQSFLKRMNLVQRNGLSTSAT
jgi:TolB-like protein/Tfp pilus assembly protein PilF